MEKIKEIKNETNPVNRDINYFLEINKDKIIGCDVRFVGRESNLTIACSPSLTEKIASLLLNST